MGWVLHSSNMSSVLVTFDSRSSCVFSTLFVAGRPNSKDWSRDRGSEVGPETGDAGNNKHVSVVGAVDGLIFRLEGRLLLGDSLGARNGCGGVVGNGNE